MPDRADDKSEGDPRAVRIDYTNWRGERSWRHIVPLDDGMRFDEVQWHPGPQWLIDAVDLQKGAVRTFALSGIHAWVPVEA